MSFCSKLAVTRRVAAIACCMVFAAASAKPPPRTIEELRVAPPGSAWTDVRALDDGPGFSARLVAYESSGLRVHALVAVPAGAAPPGGFPVLVANHGFHPTPERYGITAAGVDSRPGDYYRPIPALYARAGFIVVMPDYRGHNNSEGRQYTQGFLASGYYTEDVLALLPGIATLKNANPKQVFMWGHSLGGEVTLRALLATPAVRGASLWSSVGGDVWDQAYYYSRYENLTAEDSLATPKPAFDRLRQHIKDLGVPYDWVAREPVLHLGLLRTPVMIQHAVGDAGADYRWSLRLAKELYLRGLPYVFYSYPGDDHFFKGPQLEQAVERDVRFFRGLMAAGQTGPATPTRP